MELPGRKRVLHPKPERPMGPLTLGEPLWNDEPSPRAHAGTTLLPCVPLSHLRALNYRPAAKGKAKPSAKPAAKPAPRAGAGAASRAKLQAAAIAKAQARGAKQLSPPSGRKLRPRLAKLAWSISKVDLAKPPPHGRRPVDRVSACVVARP